MSLGLRTNQELSHLKIFPPSCKTMSIKIIDDDLTCMLIEGYADLIYGDFEASLNCIRPYL